MQNFNEENILEAPEEFDALLKQMSDETRNKFVKILAKGAEFQKTELQLLINKNDELYDIYQRFIDKYPISYMDGVNSKNFYLDTDNKTYVIKLEKHMQISKDADTLIRSGVIKDNTLQIYNETNVVDINENGEEKTYSIILTELCENGSIYDYALGGTSDADRISKSINIFKQMTEILIKIEIDGCFFPDMKNTNWLVDKNEKLYISDMKSFVTLSSPGIYEEKSSKQNFLKTFEFSPDEFSKNEPIVVDKAHVAILGKNLYQFLTKCEHKYLQELNYKYPAIFDNGIGSLYKSLIDKCIDSDPNKRPTMLEVQVELQKIESLQLCLRDSLAQIEILGNKCGLQNANAIYFLRKEVKTLENSDNVLPIEASMETLEYRLSLYLKCKDLLEKIEGFQVSVDDLQMRKFIQEQEKILENATNEFDYKNIYEKLNDNLNQVEQSKKIVENIKKIIFNYRNNKNKTQKALDIELSLVNVPILERKDILLSQSESAIKVRQEITKKTNYFFSSKKSNPNVDDLNKWIDRELISQAKKVQQNYKNAVRDLRQEKEIKSENIEGIKNAPKFK